MPAPSYPITGAVLPHDQGNILCGIKINIILQTMVRSYKRKTERGVYGNTVQVLGLFWRKIIIIKCVTINEHIIVIAHLFH